jgi:hypothetical protein
LTLSNSLVRGLIDCIYSCKFIILSVSFSMQWDAFAIPELERFLVVLNREEAEYVEQIKVKYNLMRVNIDRQLGISTADKNKAR